MASMGAILHRIPPSGGEEVREKVAGL